MTRRHALVAVLMLAVVLLAGATRSPARAAPPELVANGSFEDGALTNTDNFDELSFGSTAITGWTVDSGSVDYIGGRWDAADGSRSVDLDGSGPGSISQTIGTTVGQAYTITFQYSANTDGGPSNTPTATVKWDNGVVGPVISHATPDSIHDMAYATGQVTVTGHGSDILTFASLDGLGSPYGIVIDAVSMTPTTIQPTLTTSSPTAPGTVDLGTALSDSATLSGTAAGVFAGGTLTFQAFNGDNTCTSTPAYTQTVTVHGDGTYQPAAAFQPSGPGTYYWQVAYDGDATTGTLPASSACGDSTTVSPAPAGWTGGGTGTTSVPSDGTNGTAQFSYHYNNPLNNGASGTWTFHTVANATGNVVLPWTYTGLHAWYQVTVGLDAFVTHNGVTTTTNLVTAGPTICCATPSNGFSYSGTQTLSVIAGDTYGFAMRGSNFDSNSFLNGTLTVGTTPATTFSTTATPGPVTLIPGTTITDTAALGGVGSAGGTITFNAYAVPDCSTSPIYTATATVTGNGSYSVPGFKPAEPGTYYWTASYSGDPPNTPGASQACGAAGESTQVNGLVNDAWTRAQPISLDGNGAGAAIGSLDLSGQARWYKVAVTPGGTIQVDLTGLPANYDLAVFSDIGQAFTSLTSPGGLQTLTAETGNDAFSPSVFSPSVFSPSVFSPSVFSPSVFSPSVFSPSVFSPSVFSPSVFSPSVFSPSVFSPSVFSPSFSPSVFSPDPTAYTGAQVRSLISISANDGTADEHAFANIWNNTGSFYIRVNGRNGTYDPGAQFNVAVHESNTACTGVVPSGVTLLSGTVPASNLQTLILANYSRMTDDGQLTALQQKVTSFAAAVGGAVVNVNQATSPRVAALDSQADANTGCAYAKNLVANAIRDIVTRYRTANPNLKYIVIVGDDHAIPFFRYPDTAGIGPESDFSPPVLDTSASQASLQTNDVLSQDAYGSTNVLQLKGVDLPVPGLPVGRLIKTPTEIIGVLNAYLGLTNGVVAKPTSSLVTGYDFMANEANAVEGDLSAGIGSGTGISNDTLITPQNTAPSASWTAAQLQTQLLGKRHDLIFLGGHFSANNTLAADFSTTLNATDMANSTVNLTNSIVFSQGCHSGYSIVNSDAVPNVTQTLDWSEAFAKKGATLIAGTGYQYGDTNFLAYSGQLYADFAHALRLGTGPVAVGSALVQAKQTYLSNTPNPQGIDIKSLLESTLYGLPMLSVNMPAGRIAQPAPTTPITPTSVGGRYGSLLGLTSADVTYTPAVTSIPTPLTDQNGHALVTATYLKGPSGIVTIPGAPTLPLDVHNVGAANTVLRGVGFLSGAYTDQSGITPLTGAPATELNGVHSPFVSSAFFPSRLWTVNYFGGLTGGPASTLLNLTPAQYKSDTSGNPTDIQRSFSSVGLRLFYSNNTATFAQDTGGGSNTPALAAPPTISRVDATSTPDPANAGKFAVTFSLHVDGDPSAGIQSAWVTYAGVTPGQWMSTFLTQPTPGGDSTTWTGTLGGLTQGQVNAMQFVVQAVNGVGLVSLDDNQGSYYQPNKIPSALQTGTAGLTPTSLALNTPAASGPYGSTIQVSATLAGVGLPASGEPVSFTIGGSTQTASTVNGVATVQLPLVDRPAPYQVTAGFAGDATHFGSSDSDGFTISKLPTTLTISGGGSTALSAGVDTGISATLANGAVGLPQKSVAFVLTPTGGGTALIQTRITNLNGKASLGIVGQLAPGTYSVAAFFGGAIGAHVTLPADPVYVGSSSTSTALTIKVNQLTSGTTTCNSFFSGTGAGVTVPTGAVCTLLPGTKVTGNVVVQAGGIFVDQGAAISGNLQATNAVSVTVVGGTIGGNLQATGVGAISVTGGGTISGNLQVTGETFAPSGGANALCNTKVNGNVQVQGSSAASPFDIGNLGACAGGAGLKVSGNLQVLTNAAVLRIGGNTVSGNIQVQTNTGGGVLTGNSASGNCQLSGNSPKIVGGTNTAHGTNSCNGTA